MFWQYLNDNTGTLAKTVLDTAGVDWKNYQMINSGATNLVQSINGANNQISDLSENNQLTLV
jgi:hypothetical protein